MAVSTAATLIRLAEAPALAIAFWRCAIASALLFLASRGRWRAELGGLEARERWLAVAAGFFLALHFASWIRSLEYTTVASSTLLVNTGPIWVGLLTPLLSRDSIGRSLWIALSFAGSAIVAGGDLRLGDGALLGDALALFGAITVGLYLLAGRRLRARLSLLPYTALCYGVAAGFLAIFALVSSTPLVGFGAATWGWILAIALVPQLLGHTACNWALRWIPAALVSVTQLGDVIGSTILAAVVLSERPPAAIFWGGPMILLGIAWAARGERRSSDSPTDPPTPGSERP